MNLIIADAGPLISLAAGDLLGILEKFPVAVTDVVREETFDKGLLPNCSVEAHRLVAFNNRHAANIEVIPTQVGAELTRMRALDPQYVRPRDLGELSIQSYLITLRVTHPRAAPVVLFEDGWFTRNAAALPLGILTSTEAFLANMEKLKVIRSAAKARAAIAALRPDASLLVYQQDLAVARGRQAL